MESKTNAIIPLIVYPVNAGYVNTLTPILQGTGCPGASINGTLGGETFTVPVSQDGVWSYTAKQALKDGSDYLLTVVQTEQDGKVSPKSSTQFKTDTKQLLPQTVTFPRQDQFINEKKPVVRGTGKPGATIETAVDGVSYTTVVNQDGSWQIEITEPLPEGYCSLPIMQKDKGNQSPVLNIGFTVDTVAPGEPELQSPKNLGSINTKNPVFHGKGEPDATIDLTVDEKRYQTKVTPNGDWNFEISEALADDTHIVSARQKDPAGNIGPEKINLFTVDTKQPEPPVVISPESGAYCSATLPVIKGRGEEGSRVEVRLGEKVYSALVEKGGTWSVKVTDELTDGTSTFKVCQINKAGSISATTAFTIRVDTSVPLAPVVLYPMDGGYVTGRQFTVKGTGEPEAGVECTVAGKVFTTKVKSDGRWSVEVAENKNIADGQSYSVLVRQFDLAGNTSPEVRVKFRVKEGCLKAPSVTSPADNTAAASVNPVFTGKANPGATVCLNIGTDTYTAKADPDGTFSITAAKGLPQGKTVANLSQDEFGNTSETRSITFYVDTIAPPRPFIGFPAQGQVIPGGGLVIRGTGEAGATVQLLVDDSAYKADVNGGGSWEYALPEEPAAGLHAILAYQSDAAGNRSDAAQSTFTVQATVQNAPAINAPVSGQVAYNPPGPAFASKVLAVLKTSVPVTVDGVCGTVFTRVLCENGVTHFDYTDKQGKTGSFAAGVTWADSKPPVITVKTDGNCFSGDKTVCYSKPAGAPIHMALLNEAPFESGKRVTGEGTYCVRVCDEAGNTAIENFIVDKTQPVVSGVENGGTYPGDVCITYCDNLSGVKSALLNGRPLASGTVLTQNDEYTLLVTDFGENKSELSFKIQKT